MADEDKLFEFMTKMYSEMQTGFKSVNTRLDKVDSRLDKVDSRLDNVEGEIQKIGARIDGELIPNQKALFDGYKQNTETLFRVEQNIDLLKDNALGVNNSISEMKEDINFIAGKTIRNDSKLEKLNNQLKAVK